jgi:Membrane bound beta barrel domain (DUF5777)
VIHARSAWALAALLALAPPAAWAGTSEAPPSADVAAAPAGQAASLPQVLDDTELDPAEPDFTVINLPTTLRLPGRALAFRVTHRFARPLGAGDFSSLVGDFFGLDGGAQVGLELRFGLTRAAQVEVYRTSDRTIVLSSQALLVHQGAAPVSLAALASLEGLDNFGEEHSPRLALVLSRRLGDRGALYAVPQWIGNTRRDFEAGGQDSTLVLGLGGRFRLAGHLSLVGEVHPRLAGYRGRPTGSGSILSFGVEERVGGHSFQFNFSNDIGTTPAQIARGQQGPDDWFIGFNITRKFF